MPVGRAERRLAQLADDAEELREALDRVVLVRERQLGREAARGCRRRRRPSRASRPARRRGRRRRRARPRTRRAGRRAAGRTARCASRGGPGRSWRRRRRRRSEQSRRRASAHPDTEIRRELACSPHPASKEPRVPLAPRRSVRRHRLSRRRRPGDGGHPAGGQRPAARPERLRRRGRHLAASHRPARPVHAFGSSRPSSTAAGRRRRSAPASIVARDAHGVPAVTGATDTDAWFGVGYAVAQDRLAELELIRRQTQGRLAAILGEGRLEDDIINRRDFYTRSELNRQVAQLCPPRCAPGSPPTPTASTPGSSIALADPGKTPREFSLLNLTPAPDTTTDLAAIGVFLARTIPSGDGNELGNARALRSMGARKFDRLSRCASPDAGHHGPARRTACSRPSRAAPARRSARRTGARRPSSTACRSRRRRPRPPRGARLAAAPTPTRSAARWPDLPEQQPAAGLLDPRAVRRDRGPRARASTSAA